MYLSKGSRMFFGLFGFSLGDGKKCGVYNKTIRKAFKSAAKEHGMKRHVEIMCMGCSDNCKNAPVVSLQPQNVWIGEVEERNVPAIFKEYFIKQ